MKEYKFLIRPNFSSLERAINKYARQGWAVSSWQMDKLATFIGTEMEVIALMERESSYASGQDDDSYDY